MPSDTRVQLPSFTEARLLVEHYAASVRPTDARMVLLLDALGLALAEDLRADRDFPPFPRSTRDGYAARAADIATVPSRLRCLGEIKAGAELSASQITIAAGETAEIMTGAPVPKGADAVVMVEHTERNGDMVIVHRTVESGANVVATGSEASESDIMVARGTRVNHAIIAIAAAVGRAQVTVHRRPRVAILATGDELVDINLTPGPNEIRNSNSYSLAAQVRLAGGDPLILPAARDEADELALLLRKGMEADLLLITGGVSMGRYDLVEQVLASFAAEFFFTGTQIQPGKPVVFGEVKSDGEVMPFFGLPGNPVSTMVTFRLFVRPVLDALGGTAPEALPFALAYLKHELKTKTGLTRFLPATLRGTIERPEVEVVRWQGSGDLMAAGRANCYIVVPPDRDYFAAGDPITTLLS